MKKRLRNKTCLITGANSGIGKALSMGLAEQGARIILGCRDMKQGSHVRNEIIKKCRNSDIVLMKIDMSLQQSIKNCVKEIKEQYSHIDILINNAGVLLFNKEITAEGIEKTIATNYIGPFLLTHLIIGFNNQKRPCRIINVVSEGVKEKQFNLNILDSIEKYNGIKSYSFSKQAEIYFTYEMSKKLRKRNTKINCFYPGLVQTNLGKPEKGFFRFTYNLMTKFLKSKFIPMKEAISIGLFLACSPRAEKLNGFYLKKVKNKILISRQYNKLMSIKLWNKTCSLIR